MFVYACGLLPPVQSDRRIRAIRSVSALPYHRRRCPLPPLSPAPAASLTGFAASGTWRHATPAALPPAGSCGGPCRFPAGSRSLRPSGAAQPSSRASSRATVPSRIPASGGARGAPRAGDGGGGRSPADTDRALPSTPLLHVQWNASQRGLTQQVDTVNCLKFKQSGAAARPTPAGTHVYCRSCALTTQQ